ncbi:MAG: hypothetical protein M1830_009660 [Pleopsidium flavum]|nr:MAG: hypothetical protein M1830_009660 [Pleopsidium flavum]
MSQRQLNLRVHAAAIADRPSLLAHNSLQLNDAAQITNPDNIADALVPEDFQLENSDNPEDMPEDFRLESLDTLERESAEMPPPLRRPSIPDLADASEEVPLRRSLFDISDFKFLLGMWCDQAGITRKNYESLREVLDSLQHLTDLKRLPEKLDTLKRRCRQRLPSLKLRRKEIDISSLKLPILPASQKSSAIIEVDISKDYIYFLDPKELFCRLLSSGDFTKHIHFGMAEGFKQLVTQTNFRGVKKTLLLAEVFQQSLRLILLGAYAVDDPDATTLVKRLAQLCPTLIQNFLPPTECPDIADESEVAILQDRCHGSPSALVAIERKEIRRRGLPLFPHKLDMMDNFRTRLRGAYEKDYGFRSAAELHKQPLHYAQKLAFDDIESQRRVVFRVGDFVQLLPSHAQESTTPLQIDNIFLHEIGPGQRRLFLRVKPTILLSTPDTVLHCPILELLDTYLIVGLPLISPKKLYIVPVDMNIEPEDGVEAEVLQEGRTGEFLLQMKFDIDFL